MSILTLSKARGIGELIQSTTVPFRNASKKAGGSTRNPKGHAPGKHRGWKFQDGHEVRQSNILVTQRGLRFHPGLNVGIGNKGTLYALEPGRVMVTCEKFQPDWEHSYVKIVYGSRKENMTSIYKKYFNVIPEPQEAVGKMNANIRWLKSCS